MINVSSQLKKESNSRCYVTAKCVLSDGTTLNLEKEDFYNSGNGIVDSSDSSDFPLGVAIEKTATLTLVNDKDKFSTYNFNKARFTIFLNVKLSTGIEIIKRGTFVVNKKPATAEKINLTLVDHMSLADKSYSTNLVFPCSAGEVLRDSCQTCGIAVGDASFPNDDFQVAEAPANTTHRAVIGFCAMLAGGNARIDENDKLRIVSFNRNVSVMSSFTDGGTFSPWTEGDSVDGGTFSPWTDGDMVDGGVFGDRDDVHILNAIQDVQFDVDDVTVTGIKTTVDEMDYLYGQEGYVLKIENPIINGNIEDGLQRIGEIVVGISMRPFSLKSVANAYITFLDPVVFSDTKGHLFFSYATDVDFSFGGYTSIANTVKSLEENETEFYSGNGVVVEQAKKEMEKKLSAYDIAVRNMNQLAANTLGFYYTQVQSDDGSIIAYRHDKPNLSDSKVVYKSGIDGFFVTADYQGTDDATTAAGKWSSGFDSNGDAVLNILYAIGIQAEWINTRGFTAKDNSGNITFRVDANTGKVTIRADEFSLTGKSISEVAQEGMEDYVNSVVSDAVKDVSTQHFGAYVPTLSNEPASTWTTTELKEAHLDDLFYNTSTKKTYRFIKTGTTYSWENFNDPDIQKALDDASNAQDTADGKRRVFVTTPTPPYDLGDMWLTSTTNGQGAIKVCKTAKASGSYSSSDWIEPKYTDDTVANSALSKASDALKAAQAPEEYLTQLDIFNKLTNNGATQGIYLSGGKIYINASYIGAGAMSADRITSGTMSANRISGGTLLLGGSGNGNGILQVKNSSGSIMCQLDRVSMNFAQSNIVLNMDGSAILKKLTATGSISSDGGTMGKSSLGGARLQFTPWIENVSGYKWSFLCGTITGSTDGFLYTSSSGNMGVKIIGGTMSCSGTKSRVIDTESYGTLKEYCYEMPSPMFGDIGCGVMDENGECYVLIDDMFSETVTASMDYYVFLQKEGLGDLYVAEKTAQYFLVKGTAGLKFSWEIKVRQKEYEYQRLDVDELGEYEIDKVNYEEEAQNMVAEYYSSLEDTQDIAAEYYASLENAFEQEVAA